MNEITVEIIKLVNGGQGLGFYDGKPVFAWNTLPGETAVIELTKNKKNYLEGTAVRINISSPERIDPEEDHFMSCSPWQIMTFAHENHWKKEIAKETFKKIGGLDLPDFEEAHDRNLFGYRNKIEYGFCGSVGSINFALHKRGATGLNRIDKCLLAKANTNKAATTILKWLNRTKMAVDDLKSLSLRENSKGQVVVSLIVANKDFHLSNLDICDDLLIGFNVYFSASASNKRQMLKLLQSQGSINLIEDLAGKTFTCGPLSFFQVNIGVFEKTLARIGTFVEDEEEIVDFYSGVGPIGIALGNKLKSCVLVESNQDAAGLAKKNIKINGLKNFSAHSATSENMLTEIKKNKTIVFDPPRAGLHPSVVKRVLEVLPRKIIYLSCDAATQARDFRMLSQKYKIAACELYNFFPRTPHFESLLILESR